MPRNSEKVGQIRVALDDPIAVQKEKDKWLFTALGNNKYLFSNRNRKLIDPARNDGINGVKWAIRNGANVNASNKYGWTPLHVAVFRGFTRAVEPLIEEGAKIDVENEYGCTPLYYAIVYNYAGVVELLLKHGADITAKDENGETPLHFAVEYGRQNIVEVLVNAGADPTIQNNDGKTPLDIAREKGNTAIITSLEKAAQPKSDVSKTVTESFEQLSL